MWRFISRLTIIIGVLAPVPAAAEPVSFSRDIRPLLASEMKGYDAVVIDPPRVGAAAQVQELTLSAVPVIAFVSCNPVTFARDAEVLIKAGYRMGPVRVIDQFRWSPHVELAVTFTR
jgi:23S rRNA (uracil1939-C5)-methyltransferase